MTSSDFPALTSPVAVLRTLSAADPMGNPSGTITVSRRNPVTALNVVTADAVTVTGAPETGVNVTSLLAAAALSPVPVIETATDDDAPIGLTADSVPARAPSTTNTALSAAQTSRKEGVRSRCSEAQRNNLNGCLTARGRYASRSRSGRGRATRSLGLPRPA